MDRGQSIPRNIFACRQHASRIEIRIYNSKRISGFFYRSDCFNVLALYVCFENQRQVEHFTVNKSSSSCPQFDAFKCLLTVTIENSIINVFMCVCACMSIALLRMNTYLNLHIK